MNNKETLEPALTPQLLAMYLGQRCRYKYVDWVSWYEGEIVPSKLNDIQDLSFEIKPLLRPLSDITEDEINDLYIFLEFDKEISEREYPDIHKTGGKRCEREDDCIIIDNDNDWGMEVRINKHGQVLKTCKDNREDYSGEEQPVIFKYLLSKGFDLFGLIESGLALDKSKQ